MRNNAPITRHEIELGEQDTIITRTDLKGVITYANPDFCRISGFTAQELIGKSHNIVRHPDMPVEAFADLWKTLKQGKPWNGLVKNRCKNGDFYWVDAYVSPTEKHGQIIGYTSMRTKPSRAQIAETEHLYQSLKQGRANFKLRNGRALRHSFLQKFNPFRWIQLLSGPRQLLLLILTFILGFGFLSSVSYKTLHQVRINGPIYNLIELRKDLIADILPPPAYLVESWQLALEMLVTDTAELPALVEKSHRLREEFETRHAFWLKNLPDGDLRTNITDRSWNPGIEFLNLRDREFIPALLAGNREQALSLLPALKASYSAHRQAIDQVINLSNQEYLTLQNSATQVVSNADSILFTVSLLIIGVIAVMGRSVYRNLMQVGDPLYIAEIVRHMATGNLAVGINTTIDSQENVPATLKELQQRLRQLVTLISDKSEQVARESSQMAIAANATSASSQIQLSLAEIAAASTQKMTSSIANIANNAQEALALSNQSSISCENGVVTINDAVTSMQQIAATVREASETVLSLGTQSEQITSVVQVIESIADQTNLLALNAAIEAARAGEQGRGFAVVADEVRKLAERTSASTKEIEAMISAIQGGMKNAVNNMESGVRQVDNGVILANNAGASIGQIQEDSMRVAQVVAEISIALSAQRDASEHIAKNVGEIDKISGQNGIAALQSAKSAAMLEESSQQLRNSISRFMV